MAASEALPVLSEYVYGTAENIQEFGPRFIAFTKSMTQHALHNMAGKYPEEVKYPCIRKTNIIFFFLPSKIYKVFWHEFFANF